METRSLDRTLSLDKANIYVLAATFPVALIILLPYAAIYRFSALADGLDWYYSHGLITLLLLVGGTLVHEGLHGLGWALFGRLPLDQIHFGFQWKTITPYAHCARPMPIKPYRLGTLLPGLVLGILPVLAAYLLADAALLWFGFLFTLAAGGDFLILWLLRADADPWLVEDHPSLAGCTLMMPSGLSPADDAKPDSSQS
jgi:hypothetical protein